MNRRHRERFALIALAMWSPYDRPEAPEEASAKRLDALRRWRGQHEVDGEDGPPRPHEEKTNV